MGNIITNLQTLCFVYNQKDKNAFNKMHPRKEEKFTFDILNGDNIETWQADKTSKEIIKEIKSKFDGEKITKKMTIIEDEPAGDYTLFTKTIESLFNTSFPCLHLNEIELLERSGSKSTYEISATIYPDFLELLDKEITLESLYLALVSAENSRQIDPTTSKFSIWRVLRELNFKKINSANIDAQYGILNALKINVPSEENVKKEIDEKVKIAIKNRNIVLSLNLNVKLINIKYKDDDKTKEIFRKIYK